MDRPATPVTVTLIRRLEQALGQFLPKAVEGDPHATHQARVASRRLREALPVLAAGLHGSKAGAARRQVRRLTRALGTVRELDVTLGIAEELAGAKEVPRSAVEDVRAHLAGARAKSREDMLARLDRLDVAKLHRRLGCVGDALAQGDPAWWRAELAGRLERRAAALSAALDAAGQLYAPEPLHRVRIAGKKLRYALELAAATGTPCAAGRVRTLKRMQDLLGRLHDLQVLAQHVAALQAAPPSGTAASAENLDRLAAYLEGQCRDQHGRFVAAVRPVRELCVAIREDVVPAAARRPPARRPIKAIKMTLPRRAPRAAGSGR